MSGSRKKGGPQEPAEQEHRTRGKSLDTIQEREKLFGRRRPPPTRGIEAIVDKSVERKRALVVGALPAHVEVVFESDEARGHIVRGDVHIARVHPALIAVLGSPVVVGDRVDVALMPHGQLFVVEAQPRDTLLARPVVERDQLSQPLVANATVLWIVVAVAQPPMRPGLIDRFIVAAAAGGLEAHICATKLDLPAEEHSAEWLDYYERIGFEVLRTSRVTKLGIAEMRQRLASGFSVLVGQSGVGKSSIVREVIPEQPIAIGEISAATGKGKHTTTVTRYYRLDEGGAVVDTPGLRELGLWGANRAHLDAAFPEITELAQSCRFDNCRHAQEPGCAVRDAPALPAERLASFRKLSDEIDQRLRPGYGKPGGPVARG